MSLEEYRNKRSFEHSPEPRGSRQIDSSAPFFVVQKHKARRLHYDLRLKIGDVLKSWAVPKGPSMNPSDKRLAMMVEDHPLDYASFEGAIPEGEYGAGSVMVWDFGPVEVFDQGDVEQELAAGLEREHLTFILHGTKLKGEFALVRLKRAREQNSWLLIKANDAFASDVDVTADDRSALTGRTMDEIAAESVSEGQVWSSAHDPPELPDLSDAPETLMPRELRPMLAMEADEPFDRAGWFFEIKWDGYRAIAEVGPGSVRLYSRNGRLLNDAYPPVVESLSGLRASAVLDGELVVVDEKGVSHFQLLQDYGRGVSGTLVYYVFDLMWINGRDLRGLPLRRRREVLAAALPLLAHVRLSTHIEERGVEFYQIAARAGLEGIMAKNAESAYRAGTRSREWLKIKSRVSQPAVVGGFTEPRGSRKHLGALILGVFRGGELEYIGHTGGGSDDSLLKELRALLDPLERPDSPFKVAPRPNAPVHWVEPRVVVDVEFTGWTEEGVMRHPILKAVRQDAPADSPRKADSTARHAGGKEQRMEIDGRNVTVSNPGKVFWPGEGYTKADLVAYYRDVSSVILPHLRDRPESLNRHPDGITRGSFYQKNVEDAPEWVQRVGIRSESNDDDICYVLCQDEATLVWMANLACIELNPWLSRTRSPDNPDFLVVDLDPYEIGFDAVVQAALAVRDVLERAGAPSFPKTSGATGMHIYVPLGASYNYEQSRQFAEVVARLAETKLPDLTSTARMPPQRRGRVYLDYLQNRHGQTVAAPYCVRPQPGATVSAPLWWDEVNPGLDPAAFTIRTMAERISRLGDIFQPVLGPGVDLVAAIDRLDGV